MRYYEWRAFPNRLLKNTHLLSLRSSFVIAAYHEVRLIPRDFARLASECF